MPQNEGRELMAGVDLAVSVGWGDEEQEQALESYTWFHVPTKEHLDVAVLSTHPILYQGHFLGRGLQPCSVPYCVHCRNGIGVQKRCVLSVYSLSLGSRGLIEVGDKTSKTIRGLAQGAGGLRGMRLRLEKENHVTSGRIVAAVYPGPLEVVELPAEQDPLVVLNAQWAKQALAMRRKDGPPNVKMAGEADSDASTLEPPKASGPSIPAAAQPPLPSIPDAAEPPRNVYSSESPSAIATREWLESKPEAAKHKKKHST